MQAILFPSTTPTSTQDRKLGEKSKVLGYTMLAALAQGMGRTGRTDFVALAQVGGESLPGLVALAGTWHAPPGGGGDGVTGAGNVGRI